jgi:hypothetical protein
MDLLNFMIENILIIFIHYQIMESYFDIFEFTKTEIKLNITANVCE